MFNDNRSKKIVLTSHCILNQNSISDGTADLPGQFKEILAILEENNIGIIQLPCPELLCLGLDRCDKNGASRELLQENSRIRNLMEKEDKVQKLQELVQPIVYQVKQYLEYGFTIVGLIGINRSPSCGIDTTSINNNEENGKGVFMEILTSGLNKAGVSLRTIGVKTSRIEESVMNVIHLIENEIT